MRHNNALKKLNRTSSHRKSLLMNLAIALFTHEQIKTTLPKAKTLRPFVEKLITQSRNQDLNSRRKLLSILRDEEIVRKLLSDIGVRSLKRAGGYTRIYKFGFRYGDQAPMAVIELVDRNVEAKKTPPLPKKQIDDSVSVERAETKAEKAEGSAKLKPELTAPKHKRVHQGDVKKVTKSSAPHRKVSNRKSTSGS